MPPVPVTSLHGVTLFFEVVITEFLYNGKNDVVVAMLNSLVVFVFPAFGRPLMHNVHLYTDS